MSILTILYISFWLTVGYIATRATLELVRTLLVVGLTKLEDYVRVKAGKPTRQEEANQWLVDNAHMFDNLDDPMYNLMKDNERRH